MSAQGRTGCPNLASWHLVEGPGIEDYTHACDRHIGLLRSDKTTCAYVIPEEFPCCFAGTSGDADHEQAPGEE